jgi:hypothetical protein
MRVLRVMALVCVVGAPGVARAAVVEMTQDVAASPADVRAWLADPVRVARLSPDVYDATIVTREPGGCAVVDVTTRGLIAPMHYRARHCPTADGWQNTLVSSPDFVSNSSRWTVTATPEGARIAFHMEVSPKTFVPDTIVRGASQSSVRAHLKAVIGAILGR